MAKIIRFPGRRAAEPPSADFAAFHGVAYSRHRMSTQVESVQKIEARFRVGKWFVAPSLNRVMRDGDEVQLAFKAMDLLICLAERAGELVEKRELVDTVWQTEFVADNTLTKRIAELREALGDDAREPRYIETIPKRGYRLIAEVIFFDDAVAADTGSLEERDLKRFRRIPVSSRLPNPTRTTSSAASRRSALGEGSTSRRLLAVVGPSGAGKQPLMRAGIVARAPPAAGGRWSVSRARSPLALARSSAPDLSGDAEEMGSCSLFTTPTPRWRLPRVGADAGTRRCWWWTSSKSSSPSTRRRCRSALSTCCGDWWTRRDPRGTGAARRLSSRVPPPPATGSVLRAADPGRATGLVRNFAWRSPSRRRAASTVSKASCWWMRWSAKWSRTRRPAPARLRRVAAVGAARPRSPDADQRGLREDRRCRRRPGAARRGDSGGYRRRPAAGRAGTLPQSGDGSRDASDA